MSLTISTQQLKFILFTLYYIIITYLYLQKYITKIKLSHALQSVSKIAIVLLQ